MLENLGNKKSKDLTVKSEPECSMDTFNDFDDSGSWNDNQQPTNNEPLKNKKLKSSKKKNKDNSDSSEWDGVDDNFDSHFDAKKKSKNKKKSHKKKKPENSETKTESSKLEKFFCDLCGKVFHKKHRIQAHLRTHLGLKVFLIFFF